MTLQSTFKYFKLVLLGEREEQGKSFEDEREQVREVHEDEQIQEASADVALDLGDEDSEPKGPVTP